MAAGLELPKQVFAHGWWLKDEVKMSKSRGNVIDPHLLLTHFGSDAVRYFLLREVPFGLDGTFSYEAFIQRVNADLANDFGNLVSRTLTLIAKNFSNGMPYPSAIEGRLALDQEMEKKALTTVDSYQSHMEELAFSKALESVWDLLSHANRYLNESAPWALTENLDERPRLATILYTSAEIIRIATVLLAPVLPESCKRVWEQLGMKSSLSSQRIDEIKWGGLTVGSNLGEITPIFPRLDKKAVIEKIFQESDVSGVGGEAKIEKATAAGAAAKTTKPQPPAPSVADTKPSGGSVPDGKITIDDFAKVE